MSSYLTIRKTNKEKIISLLYLSAQTLVENPKYLNFEIIPKELYGVLYTLISKSNVAKEARKCSYTNCRSFKKEFSETCRIHTIKLVASPHRYPIAPDITLFAEEIFIKWFLKITDIWEWLMEDCKNDIFLSRGYTMRYRISSSSIIPQGIKELYRILVCGEWSFHNSAKLCAEKLLLKAPKYIIINNLSVYSILNSFITAFQLEQDRMQKQILPIWFEFEKNPESNPTTKRTININSLTFRRIAMTLYPYLNYSSYNKDFNIFLQKHFCTIYVPPLKTKSI